LGEKWSKAYCASLRLSLGHNRPKLSSITPCKALSVCNLILDTLRQSRWIVGGQAGAAARLGLSRTMLIYRMKKHGIKQGQLTAVC
jgi:transcriptional regulator with GAF, ATPase, and Fis domain